MQSLRYEQRQAAIIEALRADGTGLIARFAFRVRVWVLLRNNNLHVQLLFLMVTSGFHGTCCLTVIVENGIRSFKCGLNEMKMPHFLLTAPYTGI